MSFACQNFFPGYFKDAVVQSMNLNLRESDLVFRFRFRKLNPKIGSKYFKKPEPLLKKDKMSWGKPWACKRGRHY